MKIFTGIPFLRLLLPVVSGILIGISLGANQWITPLLMLWFLLFVVTVLLWWFSLAGKLAFIILADVLLLLTGFLLVPLKDERRMESFYANRVAPDSATFYMAEISDIPVEKQKSYKLQLRLRQAYRGGQFIPVHGNIIAYLRKCKSASELRAGHTLIIRGVLNPVPEPANPYEFNYKAYLATRQIFHTTFVDSIGFSKVPVASSLNRAWLFALRCKEHLLERIENSSLTEVAGAVCAALLTGYDDDIERPVLDSFAHTGTLHVLSVSGLHTGLIYLAISYFLGLADRHNRYRLTRFIVITICLWFFALIAGLSPPVLRAVIMFNLLGFGKLFFRSGQGNQVNILCASALLLLFFDPLLILDIGFLLSYLALAGLICFQPPLSRLWEPGNKFSLFLWQSTTGSVAATISSLPVTLYFFKQFPLWFILCNVVIIPATSVLLFIALLVVAGADFLSPVANIMIDVLLSFNSLFSKAGIGYVDQIDFSFADSLWCTALILTCWAFLHSREFRAGIVAFLVLIGWQASGLTESFLKKSKREMVVYHLNRATTCAVKNGNHLFLQKIKKSDYDFHLRSHVSSYNYADTLVRDFNWIRYGKNAVLLADEYTEIPAGLAANATVFVLRNSFVPSDSLLLSMPKLERLVCDGSNKHGAVVKVEQQARKFDIGFYNTRSNGAFVCEF